MRRVLRTVGLRDLLVHRYADIDDVAAHVAAWLPSAR